MTTSTTNAVPKAPWAPDIATLSPKKLLPKKEGIQAASVTLRCVLPEGTSAEAISEMFGVWCAGLESPAPAVYAEQLLLSRHTLYDAETPAPLLVLTHRFKDWKVAQAFSVAPVLADIRSALAERGARTVYLGLRYTSAL